jgi:hypothetical protein
MRRLRRRFIGAMRMTRGIGRLRSHEVASAAQRKRPSPRPAFQRRYVFPVFSCDLGRVARRELTPIFSPLNAALLRMALRRAYPIVSQLARSLLNGFDVNPFAEPTVSDYVPDYLIREQAAVGALVLFAVLRVIGAAVACERRWRILALEHVFIAAACIYCVPQLFDLLTQASNVHAALAALEGKAVGCAIALFFAPIVSHKLGYE